MLLQKHVMHNKFDIYFFMLSETPAYRNIESGSWFLNAIVWTFKYHAHKEEISQLLLMVGLNDFFYQTFQIPKKKYLTFN